MTEPHCVDVNSHHKSLSSTALTAMTYVKIKILNIFFAVLFLCMSGVPGVCFPDEVQQPLAIVNASIIDRTGTQPIREGILVIHGRTITAVGEKAEVQVPVHARIIDARGKWIIPGLIDAHVHFFQSGGLFTRPDVIDLRSRVSYKDELRWNRDRLEYTFSRYLCSGVTAVFDTGGSNWVFEVRKKAQESDLAPRVAVTGPLITTYRSLLAELPDSPIALVNSPPEGRRTVQRIMKHRPDLIKVWFIQERGTRLQDQLEVYRAVIEESHDHGVRVIAHARELETARAVVEAGADILAHSVSDKPVDRRFIDLLKRRGVIYITTLMVSEGYEEVLIGRPQLTETERACADPAVVSSWEQLQSPYSHLEGQFERTEKPIVFENLMALYRAGVVVAAGSDAGNIGSPHGPSLHRELELMAEAGLTPMEIIVAATRNAALALSSHPDFGTVEEGMRADLVVLSRNPLLDLGNLGRMEAVVVDGRYIPHQKLTSMKSPPPLRIR